jgi:tRNA (adenine22-N1)-methyltransferase
MGGPLIGEIIQKGMDIITDDTILILQPMIAQKELREFLYGNGFDIADEYVCREENKFYNIFKVKKGVYTPCLKELYIGKNVNVNSPKVYNDYIEHKLKVAQKIFDGLKKSTIDKSDIINTVQKELDIYREELK